MKRISILVFFIVLLIVSFQRFFFEHIFQGGRSYQAYIGFLCEVAVIAISFMGIKRNNTFLRLLIVFVFSTLVTFLINQHEIGFLSHLNGLRPYLMVFCIMIFIHDILESEYWLYFHHLMVKFIIAVLSIHTLTSLYEFIRFGANDTVGGGMGTGGSGVLTLLVYCAVLFLIINKAVLEKKDTIDLSGSWFYLFFLLPSFINETKITFLLLPIMIILLIRLTFKNLLSSIYVIIALALVFFIYVSLYSTIATGDEASVSNPLEVFTNKDFLRHYLMRQESIDYNVPRFTKIAIGFEVLSRDLASFLFGRGLGLFKGYDLIGVSGFVRNYQWLLLGTNFYLFTTFFETGLLGFLVMLFTIYRCLLKPSHYFPIQRFKLFLIIALTLMIIYNTAINEMPFIMVVAYFLVFVFKFSLFHDKWEYYTQTTDR